MRNVDLFNHNRLFWGLQKMKPFHKIRTMKAKICNPPKSEATMKISNEQAKNAILKMNASDEVKKELQRQCDQGDQGARFYVYSLVKRQA